MTVQPDAFMQYSSIPISFLWLISQNLHGILIFAQHDHRQSQTLARRATDGETFAFPSSWREQDTRCFAFLFNVFARTFGGMAARGGQRAKAKYLGFVGTTAGRNKPGSRSTSLKTQQESSRAFLALLLLSPSLHSSLLSVINT